MRDYARLQTSILLRRLAYQAHQASRDPSAEPIHDLRVAIRRLSRCLRAFSQFYPAHSWKKVRRKLRGLMSAAGDVRDHDIAVTLLLHAGVPPAAPAVKMLQKERELAARHLTSVLHDWRHRSTSRKWRDDLGI